MVSANASEICAGVTVPTNKPTPTERPSLRAWLVHSTMSNASMDHEDEVSCPFHELVIFYDKKFQL